MELLPKEHGQFAQVDYWNDFFRKRGNKAFEWYGNYPQLSGVIHKYIKPADKILMVGCGNSTLSEDLYDLAHENIINVDISETVIKQMKERNLKRRPKMAFLKMDATKLEFDESSFRCAIDKGTLDAMLPSASDTTMATKMFEEVWHVLSVMGCYIIVSLAQDHVLKCLVDSFKQRSCIFRVHRLEQAEESDAFFMPVLAFVITKLKSSPALTTIWESSFHEGKNDRHSSCEELIQSIKESQYYAMLRDKLSKGVQDGDGSHSCVRLYSSTNSRDPRYVIHIVDSPVKSRRKMAIFIVPQGREAESTFSTLEGRNQLAVSIGYQRLLVVSLSRGHQYTDVDQVKQELSSRVMELAPPGTVEREAPFMTTPEGIGCRKVCVSAPSNKHGHIYVEDVDADSQTSHRLMYFSSQLDKVQGRARLVSSSQGLAKAVLGAELCEEYQTVMAASVALPRDDVIGGTLMLGLGCGSLPGFIQNILLEDGEKLSVLEEDAAVVSIVSEFYGLSLDGFDICVADYESELKAMLTKGGIKYRSILVNAVISDSSLLLINQMLTPGGVLSIREWASTNSARRDILKSSFKYLGEVATDSAVVYIASNLEPLPKDDRVQRKLRNAASKVKAMGEGRGKETVLVTVLKGLKISR